MIPPERPLIGMGAAVAHRPWRKLPSGNYVTFSKTIGDAALLIFSSFQDVHDWSEAFSKNLGRMTDEYPDQP